MFSEYFKQNYILMRAAAAARAAAISWLKNTFSVHLGQWRSSPPHPVFWFTFLCTTVSLKNSGDCKA